MKIISLIWFVFWGKPDIWDLLEQTQSLGFTGSYVIRKKCVTGCLQWRYIYQLLLGIVSKIGLNLAWLASQSGLRVKIWDYERRDIILWIYKKENLGKWNNLCLDQQPGLVSWSVVRPFGMQADPRLAPTSGTFFHEDLVMKIFLWPFFLFRWFKKSWCVS